RLGAVAQRISLAGARLAEHAQLARRAGGRAIDTADPSPGHGLHSHSIPEHRRDAARLAALAAYARLDRRADGTRREGERSGHGKVGRAPPATGPARYDATERRLGAGGAANERRKPSRRRRSVND